MANLNELNQRLETLKTQAHSPVARVSYDGRSVEYRGHAEIAAAIADLHGNPGTEARKSGDSISGDSISVSLIPTAIWNLCEINIPSPDFLRVLTLNKNLHFFLLIEVFDFQLKA